MKRFALLLFVAWFVGWTSPAFAEANGLAKGVDSVTHAPFAGLKTVNDHLFSPVKDLNGGALDVTDKARGWVVSVGLNLGQPIE